MKTNEFENLSQEALSARAHELKQEYFALRASVLSGKDKNSASLQPLRRQIARAQTRLTHMRKAGKVA